jgi:predicted Rossmann fold flavoprotein
MYGIESFKKDLIKLGLVKIPQTGILIYTTIMNQPKKQHYDVIVIGGGASGMMAAGTAGARGLRVLLIEKNKRLGEKLRITGGGRCNVTNYELDHRKLLKHYGPAEPFLYSAFSEFGVLDTEKFFNERGITFKIEDRNRAFPHTEQATDIERIMEEFCYTNNVTVLTNTPVKKILFEHETITAVETSGGLFTANSYILATGGLSHPETGSTGDGLKWLADLGHKTADPTPSLVPITISESWPKLISGVTLSDIKINFYVDGVKKISKTGNVLCTHFGFSGPLIINSAKTIADLMHEGLVTGIIDMYPKQDIGTLDKKILELFNSHKNKLFKNILKDCVPAGTVPAILEILGESFAEQKVHSMSKEDRRVFVNLLKSLPFTVTGLLGYEKSIIADGGILLSEIDMRTMRSKKYSNLFITGDLLNINRPSGGFSLQLCWTTGFVAGSHT